MFLSTKLFFGRRDASEQSEPKIRRQAFLWPRKCPRFRSRCGVILQQQQQQQQQQRQLETQRFHSGPHQ